MNLSASIRKYQCNLNQQCSASMILFFYFSGPSKQNISNRNEFKIKASLVTETFLNYAKTVSNLDPHVMIRMTPISLILIGYNFSNKRKVTHWFLPPFYKNITECVDFYETQVDTDACAELLIEVNHLVDALEDFAIPNSKCVFEISGRVLTIKIFWKDGDIRSCARVIVRGVE